MEEAYRNNMFPECPECGKYFDPLKITCWTKAEYIKQEKKKETKAFWKEKMQRDFMKGTR